MYLCRTTFKWPWNVGVTKLCHPHSCAIALSENIVDENLVTQLDVSENVLYQNLNLPRWLNSPLNCLDENSIVSFNLNMNIACFYYCLESISYSCCFYSQNWWYSQIKCRSFFVYIHVSCAKFSFSFLGGKLTSKVPQSSE